MKKLIFIGSISFLLNSCSLIELMTLEQEITTIENKCRYECKRFEEVSLEWCKCINQCLNGAYSESIKIILSECSLTEPQEPIESKTEPVEPKEPIEPTEGAEGVMPEVPDVKMPEMPQQPKPPERTDEDNEDN